MPIRPNKIDTRSSLYTHSARYIYVPTPATDADRNVSAELFSTINGVGNTATLDEGGVGGCASVMLTLGSVSGTFNITMRVTGYDNRGALVSNDVVLTQADSAAQTTVPFYHLTEVKYLSLNSGTLPGTVTISVGPSVADATDLATIGLPFSNVPEGAVLSIAQQSGSSMPAYTYNEVQGSITLGGAIAGSGLGLVVALDSKYAAYF